MDYGVDCECGKEIVVAAGIAGASVTCSCGRTVPVPSLRKLQSRRVSPGVVSPFPPNGVALEYKVSARAAFEASHEAVKKRGYFVRRADPDELTLVYEPTDVTWWVRMLGIKLTLQVIDLMDGTVEICMYADTGLEIGDRKKAVGKVFYEIDKILGPGEHVHGELVRADIASELKRLLLVVLIGVLVPAGAVILFMKLSK